MSPRCGRRAGRQREGRRRRRARPDPGMRGNASGGRSGKDSTSVGPSRPCASALSSASSASSVRMSPIEAGAGAPAGLERRGRRPGQAAIAGHGPAARRHAPLDVDPPAADAVPAHEAGCRSPPPLARRPPRLELDDLVLRVRDPRVVHRRAAARRTPRGSARGRAASGRTRRTGRRSSRSSMIRATIARIAGSSRDASERTDASTPSASMRRAASRDCGFGPAWRKRRSSTAVGRLRPSHGRCRRTVRGRLLLRPRVEVAHDRRPVVLRDERDERLRQPRTGRRCRCRRRRAA